MSQELANVSKTFLNENSSICKIKKKGGPKNKIQRKERRDKVHKLHFEFGYSAVKISEILGIHRNTIGSDINYWYSKLSKEWNSYDIESWFMKQMHRLELQRSRLYEEMIKQNDFQKRIILEKMIFDIDSKITQFSTKILESSQGVLDASVKVFNQWSKEQKFNVSFIRSRTLTRVSPKTEEKISKLIKEDRKNRVGKW